jgi:threonine synthase
MQYVSTRGQAPAQSFSQILLGGLAPDGGLYLPVEYPKVSGAELDAWRKLSYADLAFEVLKKFATDIPEADLKSLAHKTYTAEVYRNARAGEDAGQITPCVRWKTRTARSSSCKPCRTVRRWRSRTWRCNCSAICSSTRWPSRMRN